MPGFVTHHFFGVNAYKQLERGPIKKLISNNHNAYSLGLQGPDLFFYFIPTSLGILPNIANVMHKKNTNDFFKGMIDAVSIFDQNKDFEIASAYIYGFLGHYVLDTAVHPYVYYRVGTATSKRTIGVHFGLETDIDREVLWREKKLPLPAFSHSSVIRLSLREKHVVARLLNEAINKVYGVNIPELLVSAAIKSFEIASSLLMDEKETKHKIINRIENLVWGYPVISPLLINNRTHSGDCCNLAHKEWVNPWYDRMRATTSVFDIMDRNVPILIGLIQEMHHALDDSRNMVQNDSPVILDMLGNKSYSSGIDCRIRLKRD